MRNGNPSVFVDHFGQHFAKGIDGVGYGTAEMSRMQVPVRSGYLNFPVCKTAQACSQRGQVSTQHAGVRYEDDICLQQFLVFFQEGIQAG